MVFFSTQWNPANPWPWRYAFWKVPGIIGLCAFIGLAVLGICSLARAQPPAMPVLAEPVESREAALTMDLVGSATPNRVSRIAAQVSGSVLKVNVQEGDRVEKGAVLALLDQGNQALGLKTAQASLDAAQVKLEEARRDLERYRKLAASKTISVQTYEKNLFNVRNLEKVVAGAKAEVARTKDTIERMTIRSPFSGDVVERHVEIGEWLSPGDPVATVMDLSSIKVKCSLPERYLTQVKVGDQARVVFDALGAKSFRGRVTAVIPSSDEKTRSLPIEITLDNKEGRIKDGLLARVVLTGVPRNVLLVPKDALVLDRDRATVFLVRDQKVRPVSVVPGSAFGDRISVTGPLEAGQMVVVQGNERLRPGQDVRVITRPSSNNP